MLCRSSGAGVSRGPRAALCVPHEWRAIARWAICECASVYRIDTPSLRLLTSQVLRSSPQRALHLYRMAPRSTDASISELRQQVKDFGGHIERAERQIAEVEAQLALERKRDGRRDALELEATRLYIGKLENELVVVGRMRLVCHAHTRLWWVLLSCCSRISVCRNGLQGS